MIAVKRKLLCSFADSPFFINSSLVASPPTTQQCADLSLLLQALVTCIASFAGIGYYAPEPYDRAADQITRNIMYVNIQVGCVYHPCF